MNLEDESEEDGANIDLDSQRKGKCVALKTSTRQVGAHSEGQVKIYELLDPLELEKWQLQISNKIAMQTKEFGYDPKVNGILACQWNVQDLIYSFLCIDEDMKLYISKWNAG
ncbi:26S protease regulatory subunit 6A-like protein A [Forsythia ovata]|uniref:26S protease regulatory subunit 6A-like protein A n=1 Tax=Forsythia ovata TaxID=205694 RepID=A0ABD1UW02_9LAMI